MQAELLNARPTRYLWPSAEQELILTAATGPAPAAIAAFEQWNGCADYEQHFDNGVFRLLPLVYRRMQALGVTAASMPRLKGVYRQAWCNSQILFHGVAPGLAFLLENQIDILFLKGAPLVNVYYKGAGLRPMSDIDIAVRHQDLARTFSLLEEAGWTPKPDEPLAHIKGAELALSKAGGIWRDEALAPHLKQYHAFTFINSEGQELDVHHHLLVDAFAASADAWFWESSVPFAFLGLQARRLDATALLLHVILHGVCPNPDPPVRWIADAHFILAQAGHEIRWADMLEFARKQRLMHRLRLGLSYIAGRFKAPVPAWVLDEAKIARLGFREWAEQRYIFDVARKQSFLSWICRGVIDDLRRTQDRSRLEFAARLTARVGQALRRRLRSVLAKAG